VKVTEALALGLIYGVIGSIIGALLVLAVRGAGG